MILLVVGAACAMNAWNRAIFDALIVAGYEARCEQSEQHLGPSVDVLKRNFFTRVRNMAPTDYRDQTESTMGQMSESAREAGRRSVSLTDDIAEAVRERPYTALAVTAGLAFAVGALWKLGSQRPHGALESLLRNLPDLPGRDSILPNRWR